MRGWQSLVTRNLNMFTLIAMGTGVAWLYSVGRHRCARAVFRPRSAGHDGAVAVYFEAAAVITVLVLLGTGARAARPRADLGRHPRAARSRAQDRAGASAPTASDEEVALDADRGRRSPARAAGREGPGRRR